MTLPRWKRLLLLTIQPHEIYLRLRSRFQKMLQQLFDQRMAGRSLEKKKDNMDPVTGSYGYTACKLFDLQHIAQHVSFSSRDVFADAGCGRGRVLLWAAHKLPVQKIYGIELDGELAAEAKHNTREYEKIQIIEGDASLLLPPETTVVFMYNPFGKAVTARIKEKLESFPVQPDGLRVIYLYPLNGEIFKESPRWECRETPYPRRWVSRYAAREHWSNHRPWYSVFTRIPDQA